MLFSFSGETDHLPFLVLLSESCILEELLIRVLFEAQFRLLICIPLTGLYFFGGFLRELRFLSMIASLLDGFNSIFNIKIKIYLI